jgi:hypothetical protein
MKNILFPIIALSLFTTISQAQTYRRTNTTPVASMPARANYGGAQHAASGAIGFYSPGYTSWNGTQGGNTHSINPKSSGLFGVGGDYEYIYKPDLTIGGIFRYYSTGDNIGNGTATTNEETVRIWTLGAMVKAYASSEDWLGYVGTGLGVLAPTYKLQTGGTTVDYDINTGFGFYFAMGLQYKVNKQMSFGIENLRAMGLGEKINGWPINDFMFKGRFTFGG